jgi:hypothetical protein
LDQETNFKKYVSAKVPHPEADEKVSEFGSAQIAKSKASSDKTNVPSKATKTRKTISKSTIASG